MFLKNLFLNTFKGLSAPRQPFLYSSIPQQKYFYIRKPPLIAPSEIGNVLQRRQILNLFEPPACLSKQCQRLSKEPYKAEISISCLVTLLNIYSPFTSLLNNIHIHVFSLLYRVFFPFVLLNYANILKAQFAFCVRFSTSLL